MTQRYRFTGIRAPDGGAARAADRTDQGAVP